MATMVASEAAAKDTVAVVEAQKKNNRIQVSTNKKPLYFYVNLAKRYMQNYNEVELSALGMAIGTVVTVAEILKNNGLATEKKILTSTVGTKDENKGGRTVRKAKIEILLGKTENLKERKPPVNTDLCKEDHDSGKEDHGVMEDHDFCNEEDHDSGKEDHDSSKNNQKKE